ncbi:acyl-CoA thioesterase [Alkalitalea saponilacus]|uniref:Acyl-CoA thioester hydrolase n=1 Tax=Alkalitalea saponilacus TaxID=889453 RepID=A0A1T5H2I8_9BACT|nr:thioesterase family protein [Alkalitalea saponilacus]ASB50912.1 thioesterase [Alkalitalea saponilacus]SKC14917.1 acyl-CoA thioester hydrolase [Alkalitalea saponilacus]
MLINKTEIRVRYGETDQMGIVNNAVYPSWFEIGRSELFREIGLPYSKMEDEGIMLPLSELQVKYKHPARYEEILTITTRLEEMPLVRTTFKYIIHNSRGELVAEGSTTHAFLDATTRRPGRIPEKLKHRLEKLF